MPTYIAMINWTPKGLEKIKESASRLEATRQSLEAMGVRIKDVYLVMGQYDLIAVLDAPDDKTLATAILRSTSQGNLTTQTCRAFTKDEYHQIIGSLG